MATLAPMPRARVKMAVTVNPGVVPQLPERVAAVLQQVLEEAESCSSRARPPWWARSRRASRARPAVPAPASCPTRRLSSMCISRWLSISSAKLALAPLVRKEAGQLAAARRAAASCRVLRGGQESRQDRGRLLPVLGLPFELPASRARELVELGLAIVLGQPPLGGDRRLPARASGAPGRGCRSSGRARCRSSARCGGRSRTREAVPSPRWSSAPSGRGCPCQTSVLSPNEPPMA